MLLLKRNPNWHPDGPWCFIGDRGDGAGWFAAEHACSIPYCDGEFDKY